MSVHKKINDEQMLIISDLRARGYTYQYIANLYGVTRQCICQRLQRFHKKINDPYGKGK